MKARICALLVCFAALFSTRCAHSYPGTTSLWVGMTREQALRAMGPPESVSAQSGFEYLNYTIPVRGGGYVVGRPYMIRLLDGVVEGYGYSGQFGAGGTIAPGAGRASPPGAVAPARTNQLRVVSVMPERLALGKTTKLKVKLAYALPDLPQGMISLSFNTKTPGMQLSLATRTVTTGAGELEIDVDVNPVDWANRSDVKMLASLYPVPAGGASSLAFVQWDFPIQR